MATITDKIEATILKIDLKRKTSYHQNDTNNRKLFITKMKNYFIRNDITLPIIIEENLNEDHKNKGKSTPPKYHVSSYDGGM